MANTAEPGFGCGVASFGGPEFVVISAKVVYLGGFERMRSAETWMYVTLIPISCKSFAAFQETAISSSEETPSTTLAGRKEMMQSTAKFVDVDR